MSDEPQQNDAAAQQQSNGLLLFSLVAIATIAVVLGTYAVLQLGVQAADTQELATQTQELEGNQLAVEDKASQLEEQNAKLQARIEELESTVSSNRQSTRDSTAKVTNENGLKLILPTRPVPTTPAGLEQEAKAFASSIVDRLPGNARALHVSATCNSRLRLTELAQEQWEQCVKIEPSAEPYYLNLAANALSRGDSEYVVKIIEEAGKNGLESPDLVHHMSLALSKLGRDQEAVELLQKTLSDYPRLGAHWMLLGQSQLKLGQLEDSKESLLKAEQLGVNNRQLCSALMNCYIRLKDRDAAKIYQDRIKQMDFEHPEDGSAQYESAQEIESKRVINAVLGEAVPVYLAAGLWRDAEATAMRLLAIEPENRDALQQLLEVYQSLGMAEEELIVLERICEVQPNNLMNYLVAAKAAAVAGRFAKAEAMIKLTISYDPQSSIGYGAMTEYLMERKEPQAALWYVERAIEREPTPAGYLLMSQVLRACGKEAEAQQAEKQAQTLSSGKK